MGDSGKRAEIGVRRRLRFHRKAEREGNYDGKVRRGTAVILASAALLAGCGSGDPPPTPVACLSPPSAYLEALKAAPGDVRLEGTTPISGCLVADQQPGQLADTGESLISAATRLNASVRRTGDDDAALRLGYLVGAVREGSQSTGGIHADLLRRVEAAARFAPADGAFSAHFERAFGEGHAAGQANG
jgi:hypothetical protein